MKTSLCCVSTLIFVFGFLVNCWGGNDFYEPTYHSLTAFDTDEYIKTAINSANIPNPVNTWSEQKSISEIQSALDWSMSIGSFGVAPSVLGACGIASKAMRDISPFQSPPRNFFTTTSQACTGIGATRDIVTKGYDAQDRAIKFIADKTVFQNNFNDQATISHSATVPLNHSWNDSYSRGYLSGQMNVTETVKPDHRAVQTNIYPFGNVSRTVTGSYTIIETSGIKNYTDFQSKWISPTSYSPVYTPAYTPMRTQFYTPAPIYTPPVYYNPPPIYKPYTPPITR